MKVISALLLFLSITVYGNAQNVIYSWASPDGIVTETGGKILQHNSLSISRINYRSSGYYTIQLCGKKENIADENNTLNSVYFIITLADGSTFKSGDQIEITAMRNNDGGGKSNIHFAYGNSTTFDDTNTWANLGQMHETTIQGGTEAKNSTGKRYSDGAGTEPIDEFALEPSTNVFIVPTEAEGSSTLSLTRNESECMLYITKISVSREIPAGIDEISSKNSNHEIQNLYNLCGQQVGSGTHGIVIKNGKKYYNNN